MTLRLALLAASFALTGCATADLGGSAPGPSPTSGADAIVGAMNGGLVGGQIGSGLSAAERRKALEAEYRALEYTPAGQKVGWTADRGGTAGEVSVAAPYRVGSQDCRQYVHMITADGVARTARGTACRNADGSWTPLT